VEVAVITPLSLSRQGGCRSDHRRRRVGGGETGVLSACCC
jgi:hypothetical protein